MFSLISMNHDHKSLEVMKKLYMEILRPHLDYPIQFWSPNYIWDQNEKNTNEQENTSMYFVIYCKWNHKQVDVIAIQKKRLREDVI